MSEENGLLLNTFNFRVKLRRSPFATSGASAAASTPPGTLLSEGGFQECSGLEVEMEVAELQEGGRNDGTIRRVGRARFHPIILKRGMFVPRTELTRSRAPDDSERVNRELWAWLQGIVSGQRPVARYDGTIEVLDNRGDAGGVVLAAWTFARGLPAKVGGPQLNAKTGEVAIEELHIHHEGLRMEL